MKQRKPGSGKKDSTLLTDRRDFLGKMGGFGLAAAAVSVGASPRAALAQEQARTVLGAPPPSATNIFMRRARESFNLRTEQALAAFRATQYAHPVNGDEARYPNRIANFSKTLPHNALGEVDQAAYHALTSAIKMERSSAFEKIPLGGTRKLANPQAAYSFQLDGVDGFAMWVPPPPLFSSEETAAEMAEIYWHSIVRDVSFDDYASSPLVAEAVTDLSRFARFGGITTDTVFRGETAGDRIGPYISQFLYRHIPYGPSRIAQAYSVAEGGQKFMTTFPEWLDSQNGVEPTRALLLDSTVRYVRNGRDLASYVHTDYSFQAYLNASLMLLDLGDDALMVANPYNTSSTQSGFVQFGTPHVVDMVSRAGISALKAAWFQKWCMHRRLRPEVMAGRVHNVKTGNADYPIHQKLLESTSLSRLFSDNGSYLLPIAYPEGSPTHPAYPAGHATIAGACVTILKAFFKPDFVLPGPVIPTADGTALGPYFGPALTINNELNKLAANIAIGRDTAGVHWRSDGVEGMRLGEKVAIAMLENYKDTYNEAFAGFTIRKFDGTDVVVGAQPSRVNFDF
ncbi:MAG: vanadium-dependent haloperoxidase [Dokdonella sp.]